MPVVVCADTYTDTDADADTGRDTNTDTYSHTVQMLDTIFKILDTRYYILDIRFMIRELWVNWLPVVARTDTYTRYNIQYSRCQILDNGYQIVDTGAEG